MTQPRAFRTLSEVSRVLSSGSSCGVLVEGPEGVGDAWILKTISLNAVGDEVAFYGRGGRLTVLSDLPELLRGWQSDKIFAILDRDLVEDEVVEQRFSEEHPGLRFFWRQFTIENYLLEPAWIVDAIDEFYLHRVEHVPATLKTVETVEQFLLNWCYRLAPQIAGNWTISDLTRESARRDLQAQARQYFDDLTARDQDWVVDQLTRHYFGWGNLYPELFDVVALKLRFEDRLAIVLKKIQTLSDAHKVGSGKLLLRVLYNELPRGTKPNKEYFRNRLVRMASRQVPEDIRTLVEERILPRWRKARSAGNA